MTMPDSTVFRDLALYLEREATRLRGLGYAAWAGHLLGDSGRLLEHAQLLAEAEPPLPSVESLAGIDPEFGPAESERGVNLGELFADHQHTADARGSFCRWCGEEWPCGWSQIVQYVAGLKVNLERLRQREVSCRECGEPVERGEVVFHEECLDPAIIAARAALEQGEQP